MDLTMTKQDIVSASEVVKNFPKLRVKVKERSKMIIFKNNKPDLVLFDFEEYEKLLQKINIMEDILISKKALFLHTCKISRVLIFANLIIIFTNKFYKL